MIKSLMLASALCVAMTAPSFAASGGCDDTEAWTKFETELNAMPASAEKDAAMADWKIAVEQKAAGKMKECDEAFKSSSDKAGKKS